MKQNHLIIFTRYPEPGRVKTRLIPSLGADSAARLHRRMTELALARAQVLMERRLVSLEVRYEGGDERRMDEWLGLDVECRPQGEGDLGQRMARAFSDAFRTGAERVVIIGTDCPGLSAEIAEQARELLQKLLRRRIGHVEGDRVDLDVLRLGEFTGLQHPRVDVIAEAQVGLRLDTPIPQIAIGREFRTNRSVL